MKDEHTRRRKAEQSFVRRLAYGEPRMVLTPVHQECLHADGKTITSVHAQGGEFVATASAERWIQVYVLGDAEKNTEFDPDSISAISDSVLMPSSWREPLWSAGSHENLHVIFGSVVFIAPDVLACVEADTPGRVSTWYARSGQHLESITLRGVHFDKAMCKINNTEFVVGSNEGHLCVLSHERGRDLREISRIWKAHAQPIFSLACHKDKIISTAEDWSARLWDAATKKRLAILHHDSIQNSGAVTDKYIFTCSENGAWESMEGELRIYWNEEGYPLAKILRPPQQIDRPTLLDEDCILCILRGPNEDSGRPVDRNSLAVVDIVSECVLMEMKVGIRFIVDYSILPDGRLVVIGQNGCPGVVVTPPRRLRNAIMPQGTKNRWRMGRQGMCTLM